MHRVVCALAFLAAVTLLNIFLQYEGFTPGLIVAESSTACRYFKAGPIDWHAQWNYAFFVGTLLLAFLLAVHVTDRVAKRPES